MRRLCCYGGVFQRGSRRADSVVDSLLAEDIGTPECLIIERRHAEERLPTAGALPRESRRDLRFSGVFSECDEHEVVPIAEQ